MNNISIKLPRTFRDPTLKGPSKRAHVTHWQPSEVGPFEDLQSLPVGDMRGAPVLRPMLRWQVCGRKQTQGDFYHSRVFFNSGHLIAFITFHPTSCRSAHIHKLVSASSDTNLVMSGSQEEMLPGNLAFIKVSQPLQCHDDIHFLKRVRSVGFRQVVSTSIYLKKSKNVTEASSSCRIYLRSVNNR